MDMSDTGAIKPALATQAQTLARISAVCCTDAQAGLTAEDVPAAERILAQLDKATLLLSAGGLELLRAAAHADAPSEALEKLLARAYRQMQQNGSQERLQHFVCSLPQTTTCRAQFGAALRKSGLQEFDPDTPFDILDWCRSFSGHPELDTFERLAMACASGYGGDLLAQDCDAVEVVVNRSNLTSRANSPGYHRLLAAGGEAFPDSAKIKRQLLRIKRTQKDIRGGLKMARELTRHPDANLNDFFFRFSLLNQLDRTQVSARYVRMIRRAADRGTAPRDVVAGRLWAASRPAHALEVLGPIRDWAKDPQSATVGLRSFIGLRRFREAWQLLELADTSKLSAGLVGQARRAMIYLNRHAIPTKAGEDAALPVLRFWLSQIRTLGKPTYEAVPRRVLLSTYSMGIGGAERQVAALAASLCSDPELESLDLLMHTQSQSSYEMDEHGGKARGHFIHQLLEDHPEDSLRKIPLYDDISKHCGLFGLGHLYRAIRAIHILRPEVMHVRGGLQAEMAAASLLSRCPATLVQFGSMTRGYQSSGTDLDSLRENLVEKAMSLMARDSDITIAANSREAADDWARAMDVRAERVDVLYNAIDETRLGFDEVTFRAPDASRAPVMGSVFRFAPVKDPLLWVEVAARVAQAIPDVRFLLVGDGPIRAALEKRIAALGLTDRFELPGLITEGVPEWLAKMDIFVMTTRTESLPNSVIEAQLAGLPVVAPRVGGIPEAVAGPDTAHLTERSLDALSEAVITALKDIEWRKNVYRTAPPLIRDRFSPTRQLQVTRAAYGW
ncbi:glycosyltransferase [Sulfitobacter sp. F26169L]|uniref:glycosyltransferase n=1 Tax=Sulfitobacter sp. F26169L TaxID=2996015 RepID=UPI002260DAE7|nr:glycosyltransferase [Sulfitobacter sp. F26169L]MCX7568044.1 glycosyltransferase [Sulfitobacter sp. F26169L]